MLNLWLRKSRCPKTGCVSSGFVHFGAGSSGPADATRNLERLMIFTIFRRRSSTTRTMPSATALHLAANLSFCPLPFAFCPSKFCKKFGPVDIDYKIGYQFVRRERTGRSRPRHSCKSDQPFCFRSALLQGVVQATERLGERNKFAQLSMHLIALTTVTCAGSR
jgi:hypothetical protein